MYNCARILLLATLMAVGINGCSSLSRIVVEEIPESEVYSDLANWSSR